MARLSLIPFLTLALSGVVFAAPQDLVASGGVLARDTKAFSPCEGIPQGTTTIVSVADAQQSPGVKIIVNAKTSEEILDGAYVNVETKYDGTTNTERYYICNGKSFPSLGLSCPIPEGPFSFDFPVSIPREYTALATTSGYSATNEVLFCFEINEDGAD